MRLSELTADLRVGARIDEDPEVRALAYDSRNARPGSLFVAVTGTVADGHDFVHQAVKLGAVAVVVEKEIPELTVPQVVVADSRSALAVMANRFFDHPSRKLKLLGVTGTNGKTTTAYLLESIFRQAGLRTGLIGSIEHRINGERYQSERTTPESLDLQQMLAAMVDAGVEVVVMEVSSHALDLERVQGCLFAGRVFTNLSQDHLDYHADLEDYFSVKSRLFRESDFGSGVSVVNIDDKYGRRLLASIPAFSFGADPAADYRIANIDPRERSMTYKLIGPKESIDIDCPLLGEFNVSNSAAAAALALELGISVDTVIRGIAGVSKVPGRFESVECDQDFRVLVDYAHSPDGLEKVLVSARQLAGKHRLITVFGCGGDRDRGKRPIMGRIGAALSDLAIITSDNPRSEDQRAIIDDILSGVTGDDLGHTQVQVERESAIVGAIGAARCGDVVVIAGKGHENYQLVKDDILPFSDRLVAQKALRKLRA